MKTTLIERSPKINLDYLINVEQFLQ